MRAGQYTGWSSTVAILREKKDYKRFLSDNQITADSHIKVLALYTGDFISIIGKLLVDKTYNFKSSLLVRIFDILIDKLRQSESLSESDWVVKTWVNIVSNAQTPELSLNERELCTYYNDVEC